MLRTNLAPGAYLCELVRGADTAAEIKQDDVDEGLWLRAGGYLAQHPKWQSLGTFILLTAAGLFCGTPEVFLDTTHG